MDTDIFFPLFENFLQENLSVLKNPANK